MIEAIQSLGEYALREQNINLDDTKDVVKILIEDPASNESYKKIIKIKIKTGEQFEYAGIEIDEYDQSKIGMYLYRKGSPSGTDYSPTSRITEPKKTFERKILKWFQKKHPDTLKTNEISFLENVRDILELNQNKIINDIETIYEEIKREKQNAVLTVEFLRDETEYLAGEMESISKVFVSEALSTYYDKYSTTSKAANKACSICGKKNTEVYGFVSTYAFYTVDKPGMVPGGFNQSDAWKNYPVCSECALVLEQGKQWLEQYASFNFYGFDYLLIPKPLIKTNSDAIYTELKYFQEEGEKVRITGTYEALLDDTRKEILNLLAEKENSFTCNMLIYNASKSEFKILRYIEGIYPSDLKRLFEAKKKVDRDQYLQKTYVPIWENRKKTGKKPLTFDFGCFWYFLRDEKQSKYFLDLVNDVFKDKKINKQFLLSRIVQNIRKNHVNGSHALRHYIEEPVMRGFSCVLYLDYLGLLSQNESKKMSKKIRDLFKVEESTRVESAEKIFKEYPDFFKNDSEKAVFLVGVLSQLLMSIQYRNRGATPFKAKLQGLRLDEKKVKSLLPEIQNKLDEYDSNYYRDLETLASEYFIQAQDNWNLNRDEISFYFALGMNLSKYFRTEKEDELDE